MGSLEIIYNIKYMSFSSSDGEATQLLGNSNVQIMSAPVSERRSTAAPPRQQRRVAEEEDEEDLQYGAQSVISLLLKHLHQTLTQALTHSGTAELTALKTSVSFRLFRLQPKPGRPRALKSAVLLHLVKSPKA